MADCTYLPQCPFFNDKMANMPVTTDMFKSSYCRAQFRTCARFMVARALGQTAVPADLFPNHGARARETIAAAPQSSRIERGQSGASVS